MSEDKQPKQYPSAKARHMGGDCGKDCYYCTERSWLQPLQYHYPSEVYKAWCKVTPKDKRKGPLPAKMRY